MYVWTIRFFYNNHKRMPNVMLEFTTKYSKLRLKCYLNKKATVNEAKSGAQYPRWGVR